MYILYVQNTQELGISFALRKYLRTAVVTVASVWFSDSLVSIGQHLFVLESRDQDLLEYHMALFSLTYNNRLRLHLWALLCPNVTAYV